MMDEYERRCKKEKASTDDIYNRHKGHEVQYECWEGGLYRLFCHTCKTMLTIVTYVPVTMLKFIFGRENG